MDQAAPPARQSTHEPSPETSCLPRDRRLTVIAHLRRDAVVAYDGRRCVLHGVDPGGVLGPRAYLEDATTGERLSVGLDELVGSSRRGHLHTSATAPS